MNDLNRIPTNRSPVIKFKGADSGFTFVELLVTIAIVVGLSALAIPSIRALVEDSSGNRAVSQVVDDLHLARSLAVRYHRRAIVDFDVPSNQYTLTWNQNANSRVVDISSYRNGVRFMDDPPAPSPPAVNRIIFNPQGFATTSGDVYLTDSQNATHPEPIRIEVSYAGAISELHWDSVNHTWIYK